METKFNVNYVKESWHITDRPQPRTTPYEQSTLALGVRLQDAHQRPSTVGEF